MSLLAADEPAPFTLLNAQSTARLVLICDHAGRRIPRRLAKLGLSEVDLARHIAWDIGAADLAMALSARFDACAILQTYSRLVIDCNRDPASDDAIPPLVDGTTVPGNLQLSDADRRERWEAVFEPYHRAVGESLEAGRRSGPPLPVFVHSFTPALGGRPRPWRVGVLHPEGCALADRALALFGESLGPGLVGDNQPYRFDLASDYSARRHAVGAGLPFLELEVRQDILESKQERPAMVGLVSRVIGALLDEPGRAA